ncbi:FKBP-type peptidyl-prolyl cis-trans isomerase [Algoriphagus litoralis]|uniref:FKBP-type peptidyl-prolyl cis-trans isomerase n=1 Tax=Algoriphagus litoralis TaxID=2202829 RepID=UPI000DB9236B|nr:FKBP-type peptidyl-prolyl cis-trans isomerase [Algoriphagus litoralis]
MINRLLPFFLVFASFSMIACETTNPFDTGPAYDAEANLKIDSAKIVAFLDTAQIDSLYRIHDPSGVVIIVQEEGVGTRPTSNTIVYTDYVGSLLEGSTVFDTTFEDVARENDIFDDNRNYTPLSFVLNTRQVIAGWDIAFARLRPGSKAVLVIPSTWGYQDDENRARIPPNSVLIFEIDFLGID